MDWVAWHTDYEDPESPLHRRLQMVQRQIGLFLDGFAGTPVRVVSMCAGEARDLLGAVALRGRRDIRGRLVELNPDLAASARRGCVALGLRAPDLTSAIRRWYVESGFEEISFEPVPDSEGSVGVMVYRGEPVPVVGQQLFLFNRTA